MPELNEEPNRSPDQERCAQLEQTCSGLIEERSLLLSELNRARKDLESLHSEVQMLRVKASCSNWTPPPARERLVGAAERVRNHLSYRIGSILVTNSRSLRGWMRMPSDLILETRLFRASMKREAPSRQPLTAYEDYHLACRVMNQLSYRLGNAIMKNSRTPLGWIRMPFCICMEICRPKK